MKNPLSTKAISEPGNANTGCTRLFLFVWSIGFGGGGALFFWLAFLSPILNSRDAADWLQTECTILSSKVEVHSNDDGGPTYSPEIEYEYLVDGVRFENDRYSFDMTGGASDFANQVARKNSKGTTQIRFYDPDAPDDSTLICELEQTSLWMAIFPFIFIAIGAVVLWIAAFGMRPKKKKALSSETARALNTGDGRNRLSKKSPNQNFSESTQHSAGFSIPSHAVESPRPSILSRHCFRVGFL